MARENYVGGAWVPARSGATDAVLAPATGETLEEVASSDAADVDAAVEAAADAFPAWAALTPRERSEKLHAVADAIDADMERLRELEVAQRRQARRDDRVRDGPHRRQLAVLRRWRAVPRGSGRGRVLRGAHVVHPARPARRGGVDRTVELPAQHGHVEGRARAGGRQHRGPEAVGAHSAHRAAAGRDHRRHPAARCAQRRHRPGRDRRRRPGLAPARGDGVAHRRRRHRQGHRQGGRRLAQARAPRARRQGAGDRVRRRRHRRAGREPRRERLLQLGPGLHRAVPRARRSGRARRPRRRAHRDRRGHPDRRPVLRGHRDGTGGVRRPARTGRRLRRPRRRRRRRGRGGWRAPRW